MKEQCARFFQTTISDDFFIFQDRFLPIANVARIMKKSIPHSGKVSSCINIVNGAVKSRKFSYLLVFKKTKNNAVISQSSIGLMLVNN